MAQDGRIYTTTPASVNTPDEGTATLFRNTEDANKLYAKLPDGSAVEVTAAGTVSGYLTNNIIIPTTEAPVTLSSEETELYAIQVAYDAVPNELNFPNLETLQALVLQGTIIDNVSFPQLVNCNGITIRESILITQVEFPKLEICSIFNIVNNQSIQVVNVQSLTSCIQFSIDEEDDLTTINVSPNLNCVDFQATNCALSQATVDAILQSLDSNDQPNGQVDLSGGTSSGPTGGVLNPSYISLKSKGWIVITNP